MPIKNIMKLKKPINLAFLWEKINFFLLIWVAKTRLNHVKTRRGFYYE